MKSFLHLWLRTFDYKGVTSRSQYWIALILNFALPFIVIFAVAIANLDIELYSYIMAIYTFVSLIPCVSMTVRRLHDHNLSGAFVFLGLIPGVGGAIIFIFTLLGTVKDNNIWRMNDIQRGYIICNIFNEPLSDMGKYTY